MLDVFVDIGWYYCNIFEVVDVWDKLIYLYLFVVIIDFVGIKIIVICLVFFMVCLVLILSSYRILIDGIFYIVV